MGIDIARSLVTEFAAEAMKSYFQRDYELRALISVNRGVLRPV